MMFWAKVNRLHRQDPLTAKRSHQQLASEVGVCEGCGLVLVPRARGPADFGFLVTVRVNVSAMIGSAL